MTKRMVCTECPKGCILTVEVEDGAVVKVAGNKCPKGIGFAGREVERPARVLTSTVFAKGLAVRMVPVRTDRPIPRDRLMDAMQAVHAVTLTRPVRTGEVILKSIIGLDANLIATRDCGF